MEAPVLRSESANPESLPDYGILILHTADAQEWAQYLEQILDSSRKFHKWSILLHAVVPAGELPGNQFEYFQSCKCILLLLTGALLDMLCDRELQTELQRLLHPPHRVVVLLCGVSEDQVLSDTFEDWLMWRKISAEDEPAVYVSTILDSLNDNRHVEAEQEIEAVAETKFDMTEASPSENLITDKSKKVTSGEQEEHLQEDEELITNNSTNREMNTPGQLTCLTVQPNRVQCREQVKIFIIVTHKVQSAPEVEFSSENVPTKRVPGTLENEYTISVSAPDMPAGVVSLTLYVGRSCLSLQPVTYYTAMGEISRLLDNASDPVHFMCQAFNLMSNATEPLDNMLTDSLKSRMPGNSLQLFGNKQIEENNMAACQRNEEFPTLLHFAAKYGLKKLTTILLQCPGALQAYSVMNKHGDYPNTLAEKSGFTDLRQFMDEFVETADMLKSHFEDTVNTEESAADVYELMTDNSRDIIMKYSGCSEDIYESMLDLDPECAEDLYESMNAVDENPEEAMLRKFFQAKQHACANPASFEHLTIKEEEKTDQTELDQIEEEEDPYKLVPEDIYDTVDANSTYDPRILNRPPAPIPRPDPDSEPDRPVAYISRVFTEKGPSQQETVEVRFPEAQPDADPLSPDYDPYAGMKTPGQRQLISLQERVKVGEITVNEAVQEFKAWQFDHERRANSIRYQQENLKKLRDSITRRHKEREKTGKELDYEISAPLQRNLYWGSNMTLECSVYEPAPRVVAPPPPAQAIQRDTWKTGSTSSTSSSESNRLSTHSTFSYSSGTEPDFEDAVENLPPPPRPPRLSDAASFIPPPRIPPRLPERVQEKVNDRYITCPSRAAPQRPTQRDGASAPPIPRRMR